MALKYQRFPEAGVYYVIPFPLCLFKVVEAGEVIKNHAVPDHYWTTITMKGIVYSPNKSWEDEYILSPSMVHMLYRYKISLKDAEIYLKEPIVTGTFYKNPENWPVLGSGIFAIGEVGETVEILTDIYVKPDNYTYIIFSFGAECYPKLIQFGPRPGAITKSLKDHLSENCPESV